MFLDGCSGYSMSAMMTTIPVCFVGEVRYDIIESILPVMAAFHSVPSLARSCEVTEVGGSETEKRTQSFHHNEARTTSVIS